MHTSLSSCTIRVASEDMDCIHLIIDSVEQVEVQFFAILLELALLCTRAIDGSMAPKIRRTKHIEPFADNIDICDEYFLGLHCYVY